MKEFLPENQVVSQSEGGELDVTIVVVNYNGGACIRRCLDALLEDALFPLKVEIIVVDNGSSDGSGDLVYSAYARDCRVRLIRNQDNLGYAGAVNMILPEARGRYLGVLNMDLEVLPGWLQPLTDFLDRNPGVAAVNPLLLLPGRMRVNAAGQHVHVTGLGFNNNLGIAVEEIEKSPFRVSGIHGGAFLVRTALLRKIGGMEEIGFLYHEDVNLSWVLSLCGHELYCVPTSQVVHDYFLTMYSEKFYLLERNRLLLLGCYLQSSTWLWLSPLLLCTEIMTWGYALLRGWRFLSAKLRSVYWVLAHYSYMIEKRRWIAHHRMITDTILFKTLHYHYIWQQCFSLGKERGPSARRPMGGLKMGGRAVRRKP